MRSLHSINDTVRVRGLPDHVILVGDPWHDVAMSMEYNLSEQNHSLGWSGMGIVALICSPFANPSIAAVLFFGLAVMKSWLEERRPPVV